MKASRLMPLMLLLLSGCLENESQNSVIADSESSVPEFQGYVFKKMDGVSPIDGSENLILACERDGNFCTSICISQAFPEYERFSLNMMGYYASGKCAVYFMSHVDDGGYSVVKYYEGSYSSGNCIGIDLDSPSFQGYYDVAETRVAEGAVTPDPYGRRLYYLMSLFSDYGILSSSIFLRTYEPVFASNVMYSFSYTDQSSAQEVTFRQVNGFSCIKDEELTNEVVDSINF